MQLTIPSALAWFAFAPRVPKPRFQALHQSARETSGALLGDIGAGFVELRPDGCFYEWAIMNRNPWGYIRADWTKDKFERQPLPDFNADSVRFFIRTVDPDVDPHVRRLNVRGEQTNAYSPDSSIFNVEAIDHEAVSPRATLRYRDPSLPVQVTREFFFPIVIHKLKTSATPGFYAAFTLHNTSDQQQEVALASYIKNPLGLTFDPALRTDAQARIQSTQGSVDDLAGGGTKTFTGSIFIDVSYEGDLMAAAKVPYRVGREARRMVGQYVLRESDGKRIPDTTPHTLVAAYDIPYPCLTPQEKPGQPGNLLVPVCLSATNIAYCSLRMEPVYMMLGHAAHLALAQKIDTGRLRQLLLKEKPILYCGYQPSVKIAWTPRHPQPGEPVQFNLQPIRPLKDPLAKAWWDFAGNGTVSAQGEQTNTTFPIEKIYSVSLIVEDKAGCRRMATAEVPVGKAEADDHTLDENDAEMTKGWSATQKSTAAKSAPTSSSAPASTMTNRAGAKNVMPPYSSDHNFPAPNAMNFAWGSAPPPSNPPILPSPFNPLTAPRTNWWIKAKAPRLPVHLAGPVPLWKKTAAHRSLLPTREPTAKSSSTAPTGSGSGSKYACEIARSISGVYPRKTFWESRGISEVSLKIYKQIYLLLWNIINLR